jgi:penicillin-insensitive murein endopeptidase
VRCGPARRGAAGAALGRLATVGPVVALAALGVAACGPAPGAAVSARSGPPASLGLPHDGLLRAGRALADRGRGFERARPGESTRYGTPELVAALERAAAVVAARFPGSPPLRIGDLSGPLGGRHPRHRSHRTGRDADVLYYAVDADGVPVPGAGFFAFDRFGVARDARPASAGGAGGLLFLDEARTWLLLRTLLADDAVPVQWVFCSAGIKQRLLAHAAAVEVDPEVIVRASYVLHQPSTGRPHDDHFHVRIACTARMRALGCTDEGPVWPWHRRDHERAAWDVAGGAPSGGAGPGLDGALDVHRGAAPTPGGVTGDSAPAEVLDDRNVLAWLFEDLGGAPEGDPARIAGAP